MASSFKGLLLRLVLPTERTKAVT
eukprot:SAG22_NODE_8202_length_675_cov_0.918403_2_plen_23_part_01